MAVQTIHKPARKRGCRLQADELRCGISESFEVAFGAR